MSIIDLLAISKGERRSKTNIGLAKEIADSENKSAIKELVENLQNKDKRIGSDCLKVLYEIGYLNPILISKYYNDFLQLLTSKNNRLVWGAMIASATITDLKHSEIFSSFDLLKTTIDNGSVITIDCGVDILAKLSKFQQYYKKTFPVLFKQLQNCPIKQLPQYVEKTLVCINKTNKVKIEDLLNKRISECEKESQKKRLKKLLKRIV